MSADIDPRVEKVARLLCQSAGDDPEKEIQTSEMETQIYTGLAMYPRIIPYR
jgi:hypothetical protein